MQWKLLVLFFFPITLKHCIVMTIYEHRSLISRIAMFVKGDSIITDMPTLQTAFKTFTSTAVSP